MDAGAGCLPLASVATATGGCLLATVYYVASGSTLILHLFSHTVQAARRLKAERRAKLEKKVAAVDLAPEEKMKRFCSSTFLPRVNNVKQ